MISIRVNGDTAHEKLMTELKRRKQIGPVTVHANFMVGTEEKKEGLVNNGYWLLVDEKGNCKPI